MSDANAWTSSKELGMGDSLRIIIHLEIFYLSNVGVSVNPQLLLPSHFLLAKLLPELPGTTIKTELSSTVCERTIHQIG
jgi:hypothetical protein